MSKMKLALVDDGQKLCRLAELISAKLGDAAAVDTYCSGGRMEISHTDNTFSVTVMLTES